ncbi:hypothetical protein ACEQPO_29150 [Bacillus sp. SL00103]
MLDETEQPMIQLQMKQGKQDLTTAKSQVILTSLKTMNIQLMEKDTL